ncbi:MAG TPA: hypothetical protein VGM95_05100 [Lactobacillaceae bacterium]|jgi:hypothetical protein
MESKEKSNIIVNDDNITLKGEAIAVEGSTTFVQNKISPQPDMRLGDVLITAEKVYEQTKNGLREVPGQNN